MKNRSQERSGKLPTFYIDFSSNFDGFEGCWNLVFELLASTGSKISTFWLSAFMMVFGFIFTSFFNGFSNVFSSKKLSTWSLNNSNKNVSFWITFLLFCFSVLASVLKAIFRKNRSQEVSSSLLVAILGYPLAQICSILYWFCLPFGRILHQF